ncbi:MAG: hypothetical protein AAF889_13560 [Cyanobacteria bacterium P01_D01_bin.73]
MFPEGNILGDGSRSWGCTLSLFRGLVTRDRRTDVGEISAVEPPSQNDYDLEVHRTRSERSVGLKG